MYTLEDVSSVANFITAYEGFEYNRDSYFLIRSVLFVSKGNLFDVYFIYSCTDSATAHSIWKKVLQYIKIDIYLGQLGTYSKLGT